MFSDWLMHLLFDFYCRNISRNSLGSHKCARNSNPTSKVFQTCLSYLTWPVVSLRSRPLEISFPLTEHLTSTGPLRLKVPVRSETSEISEPEAEPDSDATSRTLSFGFLGIFLTERDLDAIKLVSQFEWNVIQSVKVFLCVNLLWLRNTICFVISIDI